MSNENAQESAFPLVYDGNSAAPFCHNGLTKREYFAAMALSGLAASQFNPAYENYELMAKNAVKLADELLKQLGS